MLKLVSDNQNVQTLFETMRGRLKKYFTRQAAPEIITPSPFEEKMRGYFEDLQKNNSKSVFLAWIQKDNIHFACGGVSHDKNPWESIRALNTKRFPVIAALNLNESFNAQWPATRIESPQRLTAYPIITIPEHAQEEDFVVLNNDELPRGKVVSFPATSTSPVLA